MTFGLSVLYVKPVSFCIFDNTEAVTFSMLDDMVDHIYNKNHVIEDISSPTISVVDSSLTDVALWLLGANLLAITSVVSQKKR